MITYRNADNVTPSQLTGGFFEGWPNPPSPERHLALLHSSSYVAIAVDDETGMVVGFATAISDGVLTAFVPLLEVLPQYRRRGIARTLIERLISQLSPIYAIDLACDPDLVPFYEKLGFTRGVAMLRRNYAAQSGRPTTTTST